jgi:site-specific DNA-methyltransferase (adenine-specific)
LRDYGVAGQLGTESTVDDYVAALVSVFGEVSRVLTPTGTVWMNVGDTYGGSWGNYIAQGSSAATATRRASWRQGVRRPPQTRARGKDLQGVPWRVALAMVEHGWRLREAIVWAKPNARPESVRDRLAARYEMVFAFARNTHHWWASHHNDRTGDVWTIPAPRSRTGHAAPGPVELAARCIRLGCPPDGTVLDPFSGSGTTGVAARALGRGFVGIDLDPASHAIARQRLSPQREHAA